MNILIINEFKVFGGTETQMERECRALIEHGAGCAILTFDPNYPLVIEANQEHLYNIPCKFNYAKKAYHRIFLSYRYQKMIRNVLELEKPDYIHLNNIMNLPLDVFNSIEQFPVLQTIRDFGVICPRDVCIHRDGAECGGYRQGSCVRCSMGNPKILYKYYRMISVNKLKSRCVNKFVSPSQALADKCSENGLMTTCLNNPFDLSILKKKTPTPESKIYMYYGYIAEHKGVAILLEAFERFHSSHQDTQLIFVGSVDSSFKQKFEKMCSRNYITYKGFKKNSEIMELYKDIYCVIVPSLWIENYPNTVLEAIANKTLVIGSNRGGIPELIGDSRFQFDILSQDDFVNKLNYTQQITKEEYVQVVNKRFDYIKENNDLETYFQRLMKIFQEM